MVLGMLYTLFLSTSFIIERNSPRDLAKEKKKEEDFAFLELLEERAIGDVMVK